MRLRRRARSELVERQLDLRVDDRLQQRGIDGLDGLGAELEGDLMARRAALGERRHDVGQERRIGDLRRRDVDGRAHRQAVAGRRPAHGLRAGLLDHEPAERHHLALALGDRQELHRRDRPEVGMLPAQDRLDGGDRPAAQVGDRLVVDVEVLDRRALERRLDERLARALGRAVDVAVRVAMGLVARRPHRGVGARHHGTDRRVLLAHHRDADAHLQRRLAVAGAAAPRAAA